MEKFCPGLAAGREKGERRLSVASGGYPIIKQVGGREAWIKIFALRIYTNIQMGRASVSAWVNLGRLARVILRCCHGCVYVSI